MDEVLRELERRARNSPADGARYLQERLRQGTLSLEAISLAARLGHEAARLVLDVPFPEPRSARKTGGVSPAFWIQPRGRRDVRRALEELRIGVEGLREYGREALVRAALVSVELAWQPWDLYWGRASGLFPVGVRAVKNWLERPCDEHARAAAEQCSGEPPEHLVGPGLCPRLACSAVSAPDLAVAARDAAAAAVKAAEGLESQETKADGMKEAGPATVRKAIRDALVTWAVPI